MRLLHIADLHLGRTSYSPAAKARRMNALRNAIAEATRLDASAILVAGDVFDSPRVDTRVVTLAAKILDSASKSNGGRMPVVVIPGNHDPSDSHELWTCFRDALSNESTVCLALKPTVFNLAEGNLCVEAYPNEYRYSPNPPWHHRLDTGDVAANVARVVVAHGTLQGGKVPAGDSDSYPFSIDDADSLRANYVALGHFHSTYPPWNRAGEFEKRSVSYAGTHEPDGFGQDSGYAMLVEIEPSKSTVVQRITVAVSDWRLFQIKSADDLRFLRDFSTEVENEEDPSRFKVRIQPEQGLTVKPDQLHEIDGIVASLEALGVDVDRRGEFDLSMELEDLDFDSLPSGAIAETILELKSDLQTSNKEALLPVLREAIQLCWLQLKQER